MVEERQIFHYSGGSYMDIEISTIESSIIKRNVLEIKNYSSTVDFSLFEQKYLSNFDPIYVICKVPIEEIENIHYLENHGFTFIEAQCRFSRRLNKEYETSKYHYNLLEGTSSNHLIEALDIAGTTFSADRYSIEPYFNTMTEFKVSGERYKKFVTKSFQQDDERLYLLESKRNNEIVAFGTHKIINEKEVLLLLMGVKNNYKNLGIGAIFDYFRFNKMKRDGIIKIYSHASLGNYATINIGMNALGFRLERSFIILRKIYA
jgi:hypothetical protein